MDSTNPKTCVCLAFLMIRNALVFTPSLESVLMVRLPVVDLRVGVFELNLLKIGQVKNTFIWC